MSEAHVTFLPGDSPPVIGWTDAELEELAAKADEAARHALATYSADDWLDVDFAENLLKAAKSLRAAGWRPSSTVVEAMERCTAMHHS